MKKNVHILLILCILLFKSLPAFATHIAGGEMSYQYLGPGSVPGNQKFRFTLILYRDCSNPNGAPFEDPAGLAIYRGIESNNTLLESFQVYIATVSNVIPATFICNGNTPLCIQKAVYIFDRELPILFAENYYIVYQRCCRSTTLTNIVDPANTGITVVMELSQQAQLLGNSSPAFNLDPPRSACVHQPLNFNLSAVEPDGDSLVYRFCSPLKGGGNMLNAPGLYGCDGALPTPPCPPPYTPVEFIAPAFSASAPIGGDPTVSLNPNTGFMGGSPTLLGHYVVGVCVEEYRDGVLLSVLRREFLLLVGDFVSTSEAQSAPAQAEVWPNPFRESIELNIMETAAPEGEFRLYDQTGRLVWSQKTNAQRTEINTQALPASLYNWEWMGRDLLKSRGKLNKI